MQNYNPEAVEAALEYMNEPIIRSDEMEDCARILAAEVERLRAKEDAVCEWTVSKRWEYAHHTACGTTFNHEDQIKYCPSCGRKVKIITN